MAWTKTESALGAAPAVTTDDHDIRRNYPRLSLTGLETNGKVVSFQEVSGEAWITSNARYDGANWIYLADGVALARRLSTDGTTEFLSAASGLAGGTITWGSATLVTSRLQVTGATFTTDLNLIEASATWNNAGITFTGFRLSITDTASAAGSLLMDLRRGGTSYFSVNKSGQVVFPASLLIGGAAETGRLSMAAGTLTSDFKVMDLAATWNAAGVTFTGIKLNITDTASVTGSLLMDLQRGGESFFKIDNRGYLDATLASSLGGGGLRMDTGPSAPGTPLARLILGNMAYYANAITGDVTGRAAAGIHLLAQNQGNIVAGWRAEADDGPGLFILGLHARGTFAARTDALDGDVALVLRGDLWNGGGYVQSASIDIGVRDGAAAGAQTPSRIVFRTSTSSTPDLERMRIDRNGYLMLGSEIATIAALADSDLTIANNGPTTMTVSRASDDAGSAGYFAKRARGTHASLADLQDNDEIMALLARPRFDGEYKNASRIVFMVNGTPSATSYPTRIEFYTTPVGSTTITKQMTVNGASIDIGASPASVGGLRLTSDVGFKEMADPGAPAANEGRLYVRDNGAGKSQLVVVFNTGAVQVIATEP